MWACSPLSVAGRRKRPLMASGRWLKALPPYTPPSQLAMLETAYTQGVARVMKAGALEPMPAAPTYLFSRRTAWLPSGVAVLALTSTSDFVTLITFWLTLEPFQPSGSWPGRWRSPSGDFPPKRAPVLDW